MHAFLLSAQHNSNSTPDRCSQEHEVSSPVAPGQSCCPWKDSVSVFSTLCQRPTASGAGLRGARLSWRLQHSSTLGSVGIAAWPVLWECLQFPLVSTTATALGLMFPKRRIQAGCGIGAGKKLIRASKAILFRKSVPSRAAVAPSHTGMSLYLISLPSVFYSRLFPGWACQGEGHAFLGSPFNTESTLIRCKRCKNTIGVFAFCFGSSELVSWPSCSCLPHPYILTTGY